MFLGRPGGCRLSEHLDTRWHNTSKYQKPSSGQDVAFIPDMVNCKPAMLSGERATNMLVCCIECCFACPGTPSKTSLITPGARLIRRDQFVMSSDMSCC